MRRRAGAMVPLELSILDLGIDMTRNGVPEAHGFLLARELRDREGARRLIAFGTLYKALDRLEQRGYLASRWEDPMLAAEAGRPRRRFYRVTAAGEQAFQDARPAEAGSGAHRAAAAAVT